jgi:hypothetical protein
LRYLSLQSKWLPILLFTLLGFAVMGYHPGLEDDGVYLAAVKADLNPGLYPHNAAFFRLQTQASVFDEAVAGFVTATHVPVAWAELFWQFACLFAMLWACHGIARRLFRERRAQWAGVAMVSAMLTLPVAGTALYLADQHLHPRNAASALILLAAWRLLDGRERGRRWQAAALLAVAFLVHPLMAAMGISFCFFLNLALLDPVHARVTSWSESVAEAWRGKAAALAPLGWLFSSATPGWRTALNGCRYYHLGEWTWYEWLGALGPLLLFWLLWRVAEKHGERLLARFALAVLAYGVFQQCVATMLLTPPALARLAPLQPMRYLQLVYFAMALIAGCLMGKYALKASAWRWAVYLIAMNGGMLAWQVALLSGSPHLELPWVRPANQWLQAFAWIRENTPADAYFALDPHYLEARGEDFHGFRALAERSQMADGVKDAAVATQVPALGAEWARQVGAEQGWARFGAADFERLKREFGVNWVVVSYPQVNGLACQWHNGGLAVCEIP